MKIRGESTLLVHTTSLIRLTLSSISDKDLGKDSLHQLLQRGPERIQVRAYALGVFFHFIHKEK